MLALFLMLQAQALPEHVVKVSGRADGACSVLFDGKEFPPSSPDETALAVLAKGSLDVRLTADETLPYRCIGGTIYRLQRAGYKLRIGFISAPAAAKP